MRKTWIFIIALLVIITEGIAITSYLLPALQSYLSKNEKVDANILIIEGWLSFNDLMLAVKETEKAKYDYIITTGLRSVPEYYGIHRKGYLIFYIPDSIRNLDRLDIIAKSNDKTPIEFNVLVNSTRMASFLVSDNKTKCHVELNGTPVDSVIIEFLSDYSVLLVKEIILDDEVHIPFLNNSVYDISELDNQERIINDFCSNAELSAKRLVALGVDSLKIISVASDKVRINRTLSSAVAVKEWLNTNNIQVSGINIISSGTHSRRTWMTYNHILGNPEKIGIVALNNIQLKTANEISYKKIIRETVALFYYCLVLSAY